MRGNVWNDELKKIAIAHLPTDAKAGAIKVALEF
jgi:hypothetical protein